MPRLLTATLFLTLLFSSLVYGDDETVEIDHLLKQKQAPAGVVFEIVSDDDDFLEQALPDIKTAVIKLRKKFPELPVAIVAHGKEQFALTTKNGSDEAHSLVKDLTSDKIEVHVCGTHASWYGIMPEDFPDYINVSATGPAQINDYEELGYELIVVTD